MNRLRATIWTIGALGALLGAIQENAIGDSNKSLDHCARQTSAVGSVLAWRRKYWAKWIYAKRYISPIGHSVSRYRAPYHYFHLQKQNGFSSPKVNESLLTVVLQLTCEYNTRHRYQCTVGVLDLVKKQAFSIKQNTCHTLLIIKRFWVVRYKQIFRQ